MVKTKMHHPTMKCFNSVLLFVALYYLTVLVTSRSGVQGVPSQERQEIPQQTKVPLCACSKLWAPVCGTDGKTYENEGCLRVQTTKCGIESSLVSEAYEGECQQSNTAVIAGERLSVCIFVCSISANLLVVKLIQFLF